MGKNIEIKIYTFKTLVFGQITYISPECTRYMYNNDFTCKKDNRSYIIRLDTEASSEICDYTLYIGTNSDGTANTDVFYKDYGTETEAEDAAELFSSLAKKIENMNFIDLNAKEVKPGEIKSVLSI